MMPCVAKDTSDLNRSPVRAPTDRPKNIYKPKYHAFSIDSLVGNCDKNDTKTGNNSDSEESDKCLRKPTTPPPSPPAAHQSATPTPPLNGHKPHNDNSNTSSKCYETLDDSNEGSADILAKKEGILRSYMTHTPGAGPHINTSHQNSNYITSLNHNSDESVINHSISHRFGDSIHDSTAKYDHIMSLRSSLTDSHNSSTERVPFGGHSALQTSPFNSSQYYCNQLYCRPFDERLIQNTHPFLPQVCDYKILSSKSPDICCQTSYNPYRKPKRIRTAFSPGQLLRLEEIFERNRYVVGCERKQLARDLNLSETQIKVWFQNRRTKHKREKHQQIGNKRTVGSSHLLSSGSSVMSINGGNSSDDNDVDDYDRKF